MAKNKPAAKILIASPEKQAEVFFNPFQTLQYTPAQNKKAGEAKKQPEKVAKPAVAVKQMDQDLALFQAAMAGQGVKKALPDKPALQSLITERPKLVELAEQDESLFVSAMQGVNPVDGKGRDLPLKPKNETKTGTVPEADYLKDFLEGKIEFALEYTEEFFEGHVMGLDPLVAAKLRAGQYSPEANVDLHGQNAEQAQDTLINFIHQAYNKSQRFLIVVTGRGKNSPGGLGILRKNMQEWLTQNPLKRVVLAFCTAQAKDGGTGAVYILLRRFKKSKGKIQWDRREWPE
ncbi:MAG: Smr/MutS family protein [Deltaproteobacteria bacterium]|jgi:DNA-nicking Smr family endonuclease|nr:Smr/MutS family protein [Deltaproteobacteria bacterium]